MIIWIMIVIISLLRTPGVGKTFFLLYMIFKFKEEKKAIGVSIGDDCMILEDNFPRVCERSILEGYLLRYPKCIYLHDPFATKQQPIRRGKGITVITTSVDPDNIQILRHRPQIIMYMPVWSLDELICCSHLCYSEITKVEVVKRRFYYWGGSARNVFVTDDSQVHATLETILTEVKSVEALISRIEASMNDNNSGKKFQWLRHMLITNSYDGYKYDWPSPYIRRSILMKLKEVQTTFLTRQQLLANASYVKSGNLFGDYVKDRLMNGCDQELIARTVDATGVSSTCKIPFPKRYALFFNGDIMKPEENVLYVPGEPNKESVDFVILHNATVAVMLQITIGKTHPKKAKGIQAIKDAFPSVADWKFCWVIPVRNNKFYEKKRGDYVLNFDYTEQAKYHAIIDSLHEEEDMGTDGDEEDSEDIESMES